MPDNTMNAQVVYQLHPNSAASIKNMRDQFHQLCGQYLNHQVRVQTIDGHQYEGTLTSIEGGHLYLSPAADTAQTGVTPYPRAYYPGYPSPGYSPYAQYNYANTILPLVLYELLVISLL